LLLAAVAVAQSSLADQPAATAAKIDAKTYQQTVDRAIQFLKNKQAPDGSFAAQAGPGVTAVVTTGLMRNGLSPDDPTVAKALKYLQGFVQADGSVCAPKNMVQNYETSLAVVCFHEANGNHQYDALIKNAEKYLKSMQWGGDNQEGVDKSDPKYGGAGYGKHKRPDLSNTQFFLDALQAAGNGPDDPAVKRALVFVSRCQNLETENNTTPMAAKNPDGGFYYTPAAGGISDAGTTENGGLRSYGSMTYAGLKSMIYAGVKADDPRVKAAIKWCQMHYGLDSNPGMGAAGLYYYYQTFAKALAASGLTLVQDDKGVKHDWRQDLLAALVSRQRPNGSWVNEDKHWYETEPSLVTGYALLSLAYCRPAGEK
jgi:squalene-hopene/tetraprenyl-beta-curcumene cyclase